MRVEWNPEVRWDIFGKDGAASNPSPESKVGLPSCLITGVGGFIGSHLADALVKRGYDVRGLDNFSTGRRENLAQLRDRIEVREADLRDSAAVDEACAGMDSVLHEAALPSVPRSIADPRTSHETNLNGTLNVLEGARAGGVRRVVFAASSSAYGDQPGFPRVETMRPQPIAPYPVQKVAAELYLQSYWQVYGLETVSLRYFNVFGPRQDPGSPYSAVIAKFIAAMTAGRAAEIYGDGEQRRDFTFIDNVVRANVLALEAEAEAVSGKVFNVATGEAHTLNELYAELARITGCDEPAQYVAARRGDVRDSLADVSAAGQALGYAPTVGFREGLERTVAWYKAQDGGGR